MLLLLHASLGSCLNTAKGFFVFTLVVLLPPPLKTVVPVGFPSCFASSVSFASSSLLFLVRFVSHDTVFVFLFFFLFPREMSVLLISNNPFFFFCSSPSSSSSSSFHCILSSCIRFIFFFLRFSHFMPCACGFVLLPPPILVLLLLLLLLLVVFKVWCFLSLFCLFFFFFFFSCLHVKKILSRACFFCLSPCVSFLVSFFFLFFFFSLSRVCQKFLVRLFCIKKSKARRQLKNLSQSVFFKNFSRHSSSLRNFYSIRRPSSFEGGGLFIRPRNEMI